LELVRAPEPSEALADLFALLQADEAWTDALYIARQLLVVDALACDDPARAAALLRDVVESRARRALTRRRDRSAARAWRRAGHAGELSESVPSRAAVAQPR
jgi:hypothetical protein